MIDYKYIYYRMEPASPEKLLKAFETLDPENKRFLTKEYFGKLMEEEAEKFSKAELANMWPVAIDPITGNIPYLFYINQLKVSKTISIKCKILIIILQAQNHNIRCRRCNKGGARCQGERKEKGTFTDASNVRTLMYEGIK